MLMGPFGAFVARRLLSEAEVVAKYALINPIMAANIFVSKECDVTKGSFTRLYKFPENPEKVPFRVHFSEFCCYCRHVCGGSINSLNPKQNIAIGDYQKTITI